MTLSARYIKRPRQLRRCSDCGRWITGPQVRAYGMADLGDKPFTIYGHPTCFASWRDAKVQAVLPQDADA